MKLAILGLLVLAVVASATPQLYSADDSDSFVQVFGDDSDADALAQPTEPTSFLEAAADDDDALVTNNPRFEEETPKKDAAAKKPAATSPPEPVTFNPSKGAGKPVPIPLGATTTNAHLPEAALPGETSKTSLTDAEVDTVARNVLRGARTSRCNKKGEYCDLLVKRECDGDNCGKAKAAGADKKEAKKSASA